MKNTIILLFFILNLQQIVKADDISDFQIEGMSIGDSLLDYVTRDEIEKKKSYYPKSKKWAMFSKLEPTFKIYDSFQVHFKDSDSKYIIGTLDATIHYKNNIKDCYKKMDEIEDQITEIFENAKIIRNVKESHTWDKSGKSIVTDIQYWLKSGDIAILECVDWSNEVNFIDGLTIKIGTREFLNWINNEAYD